MYKIINRDILEAEIEDNSIDLIVTSPPYNLDIDYATYKDLLPYDKYLKFNLEWMSKVYQWAKDDGRFCLNIPFDKNKGGIQSIYLDLATIAKEIGWNYETTVIWNKEYTNRGLFTRGSWNSASSPVVIAPAEAILIMYKKQWKKLNKGVSDIQKHEFIKWTEGVWTFRGENTKLHPAAFPEELPERCIKLFSYAGDTILDPFAGSFTTIAKAVELERNGIGIEMSEDYCKIGASRIEAHQARQVEMELE